MSILRNRFNVAFVQVPNAIITDTRISMPARLVYVYLRTKPDNWTVYNAEIMKSLGIKNGETMAKYWSELEESGWLVRRKTKNGTFDYEICEIASNEEAQIAEKPNQGKILSGKSSNCEKTLLGKKPGYNNIDYNSNTDYNRNIDFKTPYNTPHETCGESNENEPLEHQRAKGDVIAEELKHRINALFNRRESTAWSEKETKQLKTIAKREGVLDELTEIEALYNSGYQYRRRDIVTFLNNFNVELDRARNKALPTYGGRPRNAALDKYDI